MSEFFANPVVNVVILAAVTAVMVAVGVYVIGKVRASARGTDPQSSEWLTKFQDLHAKGELSDEEYRTIKGVLADRLQQELKGTDETR
jgi:uncharacterized membrane protein